MERTFWQKLEGTTDQILNQLKKLVDEGNIRRVVVRQRGRTIAEFPLTAGVIGAVLAPVAAAIGAISALLAECSIEVEKTVPEAVVPAEPITTEPAAAQG
jgi:predicted ArsR family transcriptional regulator